ncbi:DNA polymerase III, subunit gamma and tau [Candidatus Berkelbacteria bacterium CG_4_10_14_0_8_um_filter_35_9_33_8]|uniref:DNA polymerase III subunit gamma/tau n=1 Tax=Candidatus Berkelbacteria bacterium CG_4_10_14_0_2_um_filter_35_9_33_12 TaxID=1974499 RepID=A0A2M7W3Y0_9BACT|nr:MAG: DNA polymerase III, subunit gamma and tau [Candidatus Berkelbacteria bacterium CG23_combo_of_CG06-09_8_20_14_all_33_15]PIS08354.1 MAG: DNA polymerase III, subunit gamma and tau [Candidatus Berkelbacteria bacterium CG10_big_fil_rev_8_21_14_0_10_33_10]PIZ28050.1 MAG: DNA polymerase III, subunit gamma and tau [Candidatus Berkelbacteria bacterium CG_4_10_14_0_8_um_filter_35_9_33_8]PJA20341.1 MAG: DNA polymerase III, subunit gamma and tau [Candidatus Berkelbacteria bacterium CG_4_10_14_0_2_um
MALYHKYRPQVFAEVLGQDHIIEIITNALKQDRVYHAYLFCGPRGLGKTTVARILAKAVNCDNNIKNRISKIKKPKIHNTDPIIRGFEPCEKCQSCLSANRGSSLDIIEIDAASNRGIDEIRELREKSRFNASVPGRKKTFIIDEVHMLTKEAFNALLKTIEEPLEHLMFVMATTEAHKIPATILSRVQRFDFKKPPVDMISKHIDQIAKKEKISLDQEAILILSKLAEGSFRDALSLLDQIKEAKKDRQISGEDVIKNFGLARISVINQLIDLITSGNNNRALAVLEKMEASGVDPNYLTENMIENLIEKLKNNPEDIYLKSIEILARVQNKIRFSPLSYLPLKLAVFKIRTSANPVIQKIIEEKKADQKKEPEMFAEKVAEKSQANPVSNLTINSQWTKIINQIKAENPSLSALLESCSPKIKGDKFTIMTRYKFHKDTLDKNNNLDLIKAVIAQIFGREIQIAIEINPEYCQNYFLNKEEELVKNAEEIFN